MPSTAARADDSVVVPASGGGHLTIAALRHRPRQAGLVLLMAALVSASAVVGPLYSRASEQSVLASSVADDPAASALVVSTSPSTTSTRMPTAPDRLAAAVRSVLPPDYGTPVLASSVNVTVSPTYASTDTAALRSSAATQRGGAAPGRLVSRSAVCRHLHLVAGRCMRAGGEVLVGVELARRWRVSPGSALTVISSAPTLPPTPSCPQPTTPRSRLSVAITDQPTSVDVVLRDLRTAQHSSARGAAACSESVADRGDRLPPTVHNA